MTPRTRGHVLHHTADLDWIPLSAGTSFKPIVFFPDDAGYQLLLRVEPGTVVARHHHTGDIHAFVLSGQRRIGGCDEVIRAGSAPPTSTGASGEANPDLIGAR